ncbi:DUF3467 domain-containing protein [Chloroflexota bacterium]
MEKKDRPNLPEPEITDSMRSGVYANYFAVSAGKEKVIIDFGNILPEPGKTELERNIIVSRVVLSKEGAQKLANLINQIMKGSASKTSA